MTIAGLILAIIFIVFGLGAICLYTLPYIIAEIKCLKYKIDTTVEDVKCDINKRSETRRNRLEIKRKKDNELAEKKLDAKLTKVNKKIEAKERKLNKLKGIQEEITSQHTNPEDEEEVEEQVTAPPPTEDTNELNNNIENSEE